MTTKKTRIFSQKQMQTQIAQGGTLTLPLESALEGLKGPLEASLLMRHVGTRIRDLR